MSNPAVSSLLPTQMPNVSIPIGMVVQSLDGQEDKVLISREWFYLLTNIFNQTIGSQNKATTGAATATFTATNKPGSNSAPALWIPLTLNLSGTPTTYYIPLWT